MKKSLQLLGLAVFALLVVAVWQGKVFARITGTPPTNADIVCFGPSGFEACLDASANWVPTTNLIGSLGSTSLQWASVNADDLIAGDLSGSRSHPPRISTTTMITLVPGAVGDIFTTTINGNRFALCIATATVANSIVLSTATNVRCADAVSQNGQLP